MFWAGKPAKARRHISMRIRSTTAERRRMAAVPSPVRSQVWRTSAISRVYCSRRSSTAKATGFISVVCGSPKQEGIVNSISEVGADGGFLVAGSRKTGRAGGLIGRWKCLFRAASAALQLFPRFLERQNCLFGIGRAFSSRAPLACRPNHRGQQKNKSKDKTL